MSEIVAKYHGVNVIKSCGRYYPEVNGNIECKTIKEVKEWIENVWLFCKKSIFDLADEMGHDRELTWNFFLSLGNL